MKNDKTFSANISHNSTTKVKIHEYNKKQERSAKNKVLALECFIKLEFQHKK